MSNEKTFFDEQIASLRALSSIHQYLAGSAASMDASSLLRSEYVLIVSTFDSYLHNIVRRKIRENFFASSFLPANFNLPITAYLSVHNEPNVAFQQQIFDASLRSILEKDSFQSPKSVEYALGLVNVKSVWTKVSPVMGDTAEHIRDQLALIVKRRNQIAHESDIDPSTSMLRNIDLQTVNDCRDFLQRLVSVIDTFI